MNDRVCNCNFTDLHREIEIDGNINAIRLVKAYSRCLFDLKFKMFIAFLQSAIYVDIFKDKLKRILFSLISYCK